MVVTLAVVVDGRSEEGLQEGAKEVLSHVRPHWKQHTLTFKIVHKAGCGPEVYAAFINGLCYEFTPGAPLTIDHVGEEEVWRAVARQSARFHNIQAALQVLTDELEAHLTPLSCPVVFCHNDLALKNIIWRPEDSSVSFIDYEYSAANYQPFDIANHFNEYSGVEERDFSLCPGDKQQRAWLRSYLSELRGVEETQVEEVEVDGWMGWVSKFSLASHLFWGVWAFLQACHSSIDFDYVE
ncbi:hypothetical protein Pmani_032017 [Petrolisthes manimaculis]|uniref:ethanolamine kinase n=1 Tax=Petrolisthes manimaculis TaxID=1843537 RepID=A0AAE1TU71_9EUCA|nr:hypothetical protein Pmani_032017 [Petrolisthes manimaculis]